MGHLNPFQMTLVIMMLLSATLVINLVTVTGQISTPCTTSMITNFTPCANYITGSTNNNGLVPSATCCDAFKSLMGTNMQCACLLVTANVPLPLPINRALALFLPQACNVNGMPSQCKASGSPLPAPGPAMLVPKDPTIPPSAAAPSSPQVSKTAAIAEVRKLEHVLAPAPLPAKLTPMKHNRPRKVQISTSTLEPIFNIY
ncbi:non-specific lipid transfer protein GPI-anchored 16-like isoform X1 [Lotus japonicus]|uniref:non-specific lipid transfer protein GPI-anchored 16-like isoform X1 n=1 Tax=Lotus japonicus TaxID=34305 RepID=UPI00258A4815|nr:non-specific lipid transfer protein GPI-anchored 16-like isoform X1 [Lotus japonicus]